MVVTNKFHTNQTLNIGILTFANKARYFRSIFLTIWEKLFFSKNTQAIWWLSKQLLVNYFSLAESIKAPLPENCGSRSTFQPYVAKIVY